MAYFVSEVKFEALEMKIAMGWYVIAKPPKGTFVRLGGFKTEAEAQEWIDHPLPGSKNMTAENTPRALFRINVDRACEPSDARYAFRHA